MIHKLNVLSLEEQRDGTTIARVLLPKGPKYNIFDRKTLNISLDDMTAEPINEAPWPPPIHYDRDAHGW